MQVSPYLYVDDSIFVKEDGTRLTPGYDSLRARTLFLNPGIAKILREAANDDGKLCQLSDSSANTLKDEELICEDADALRAASYARMTLSASDKSNPIFVLLPTSYCNMSCGYCGQEHVKGAMTIQHRNRIVERVTKVIEKSTTRGISIRWFGGEPLMAFATIRAMSKTMIDTAACANVDYRANMTTNGVLLDRRKLTELVNACQVDEFHITLDGPADIHDNHRPLKSGSGSFERITGFLRQIIQEEEFSKVRFILRTNVDTQNSGYVNRYLDQMANMGFGGHPNVLFNLIPVHPWGNDVSQIQVSNEHFASEEVLWLKKMSKYGLNTVFLPTQTKKLVCGAVQRASEVITSESIYSCTEHPLVPGFDKEAALIQLSDVSSNCERPLGEFDGWSQQVSRNEFPCGKCWMLPVCGGHCPKSWYEGTPACPSIKFNIAARLRIVAGQYGLTEIGDLDYVS